VYVRIIPGWDAHATIPDFRSPGLWKPAVPSEIWDITMFVAVSDSCRVDTLAEKLFEATSSVLTLEKNARITAEIITRKPSTRISATPRSE
jgi:hypothetical protein